jgi:hypothetical protein
MSEALENYRALQERLTWIRWTHLGHDSLEEDAHLDKMDDAWWKMSCDERDQISCEPSREDPISPNSLAPEIVDIDIQSTPGRVRKMAA